MTTVHASPDYAISPQGDPPPGYPNSPVPDTFTDTLDGTDFPARRAAFLVHVLRNPAPRNTKPVWYELARLAAGGQSHEGVIFSALDFIDARKDCADFVGTFIRSPDAGPQGRNPGVAGFPGFRCASSGLLAGVSWECSPRGAEARRTAEYR